MIPPPLPHNRKSLRKQNILTTGDNSPDTTIGILNDIESRKLTSTEAPPGCFWEFFNTSVSDGNLQTNRYEKDDIIGHYYFNCTYLTVLNYETD